MSSQLTQLIKSLLFSQPQELAILHDTRRQSTVISREPIELLVISKEVRRMYSIRALTRTSPLTIGAAVDKPL